MKLLLDRPGVIGLFSWIGTYCGPPPAGSWNTRPFNLHLSAYNKTAAVRAETLSAGLRERHSPPLDHTRLCSPWVEYWLALTMLFFVIWLVVMVEKWQHWSFVQSLKSSPFTEARINAALSFRVLSSSPLIQLIPPLSLSHVYNYLYQLGLIYFVMPQ